MNEPPPSQGLPILHLFSMRRHTQCAGWAAALAALSFLILPAQATAQDRFDQVPDLVDHGRVDDWRVGKLDSDDIWLGRACVLFKTLSEGPNPISVSYRFEPGDEQATITFEVPQAESISDPDAVDWGYLERTDIIYALNGTDAYEIQGHIGWEYIDPRTVYMGLSFELDAAGVDRLAASDWVGVAIKGGGDGVRFDTGRTTRAVAWARQCLAGFD